MSIKNKQRAKLALAELEKEMEILSKEEMNACKGGGPQDVIVLFDTKAVSGFGHTAVLIGDDISGWRYYSSNGTDGFFGIHGAEKNPDIGLFFKDLSHFNNSNLGYNYNKRVRIATTAEEDEMARNIARERVMDGYTAIGNSCLDVSRDVVNGIYISRGSTGGGNGYVSPNGYLGYLRRNFPENMPTGH